MTPDNQQPAKDDNNRPGMAATSPANTSTAVGGGLSGNIFTQPPDDIDRIIALYDLRMLFFDDFSKGFQGWQQQHDSNRRTGITLSEEARYGNYSLLLHSRAAANDEAWCRKGLRLPPGAKKLVIGCQWMGHSSTVNDPAGFKFELDTQRGSSARRFFSARYLHYSGGVVDKWQVNTGGAVTYTDVPGATQPFTFNESGKPMPNFMALVIDYENLRYERLFANNQEFDLTAFAPTDGGVLTNFEDGMVAIMVCQNRSDSNVQGQMFIEKPFLGVGY